MNSINQSLLQSLIGARKLLSDDAVEIIRSFILSKVGEDGGFMDRSGNPDPYYSVFGYTLSYVFDVELDIQKQKKFLDSYKQLKSIDFVHAIILIRCYYLLNVIKYIKSTKKIAAILTPGNLLRGLVTYRMADKIKRSEKDLLLAMTEYRCGDGGFNHLARNATNASVYANFLAYGLFEDLHYSKTWRVALVESNNKFKLPNGSYVNHPKSQHGISSSTAAAIILAYKDNYLINDSVAWLKNQISPHGGFLAGENVPVADLLSTATSLFALNYVKASDESINNKAVEFANLHWHESGGFFGSIADQIPDVEYTFYGLLTLGQL